MIWEGAEEKFKMDTYSERLQCSSFSSLLFFHQIKSFFTQHVFVLVKFRSKS